MTSLIDHEQCVLEADRFDVYRCTLAGSGIQRYRLDHPGAVVIVPLFDASHVVLIRNARFSVDQLMWEVPAGGLKAGEDVQAAAGRELEEETGYRAAVLERIPGFYPAVGMSNEFMHLFVARDLEQVGQSLEADEKIQVHLKSWEQVLAMLEAGEFQDAKTIAALLWVDRFVRDRRNGGCC